MGERWMVELTSGAVAALRRLPRGERASVAARIDLLAESGLPPALRDVAEGSGGVSLHVAGQVLRCLEDPEQRRICVITLGPARVGLRHAVGTVFRRMVPAVFTNLRGGDGMGWIAQDLRFAVRSLRRSPGFTFAALLTLALGIGATTAIFTVAHGVLLSPLPYGSPERVVTIWSSWNNFPDKTWVSVGEYRYYYQNNNALEDLALYGRFSANFTSIDLPERVGAAVVTPNTFSVLGVQPVVGRVFTWDEAQDSVSPVLLGFSAWQRRYSGDPGIVGRDVEIDGQMLPVVGVLPEGFALPIDYGMPEVSELFYPMYVDLTDESPVPQGGGSHGSYAVGRLKDGETPSSALADLENVLGPLRADGTFAEERNFHPRLYAAKADIIGSARTTIAVLLGAVAFVLLIACGNVANLLLSRSATRLREVAVRTALGAGRTRILRQLMTESLVLAFSAGILGLALAYLGVQGLLSLDPDAVPRADGISLNRTVVLFSLIMSVLTALLFGAVPALRVARGGVSSSLHEGGRGGGRGVQSNRLQGLLVASQMAMAVVLLMGSVLMIQTFVSLTRIDPGFRAENVLTLDIAASPGRYPDGSSVSSFYGDLLGRIDEIPGVRGASAVRRLPLATTMGDAGFRPVGYQPETNESTQADWQWATPGYVEIMGIPVLEGRSFDERDVRGGPTVVMINRTLARRYWGDRSPIGSMVAASGGDTAVVVGVLGDLRHNGITTEVKTRYYRALAQVDDAWTGTMRGMTLAIGSEGDPRRLIEPVRAQIRAVDPSMPVANVQTVEEVLSSSVAQSRFGMTLLGAFAGLALTLAVVGIYGVLAYAVSQRSQEIGIRLALGAEQSQVVGMVVRQGMLMALTGVALGTGVAWFITDFMAGLLYGVTPQDPLTFAAVPALFVAVALLACWLPAARASRVRPANALHSE